MLPDTAVRRKYILSQPFEKCEGVLEIILFDILADMLRPRPPHINGPLRHEHGGQDHQDVGDEPHRGWLARARQNRDGRAQKQIHQVRDIGAFLPLSVLSSMKKYLDRHAKRTCSNGP